MTEVTKPQKSSSVECNIALSMNNLNSDYSQFHLTTERDSPAEKHAPDHAPAVLRTLLSRYYRPKHL